jgi:DNA-directed RNA polymerase subunit RPC12/RpoP
MSEQFLSANRGRYAMVYRCAKCQNNVPMQTGFSWVMHRGLRVKVCKPCGQLPKVTK